MNEFRIPSRITLAGIPIDIVLDDTFAAKQNCAGQSCYQSQTIHLDSKLTPADSRNQTFWHEVTHWIFYIMGEDELRNNERIVDLLAHLIYQSIKTAEYNDAEIKQQSKKK